MLKKIIATIILLAIVLMGMAGCSSETLVPLAEENGSGAQEIELETFNSNLEGLEVYGLEQETISYTLEYSSEERGKMEMLVYLVNPDGQCKIEVSDEVAEEAEVSSNFKVENDNDGGVTLIMEDDNSSNNTFVIITPEGVNFEGKDISKVTVKWLTSDRR